MISALLLSVAAVTPADTTLTLGDRVDIELVYVAPGGFQRRRVDGSAQAVVISSGFWLGRYEVTWRQWRAVMGWDDGRGQPDHPARRMTWLEAEEFLRRASLLVDGWTFRLPTEAEWEYAARAGTRTAWASGSDSLDLRRYAWTRGNADGVVQPVGTRLPNSWGLHDMHGNVWEWVGDWMAAYPADSVVTDPRGPPTGEERVRRGGSAVYGATAASSSYRYQQPPTTGNGNLGLRIVAVPDPSDRDR